MRTPRTGYSIQHPDSGPVVGMLSTDTESTGQGQPSADRSVIVPDLVKLYLVRNNTTGSNQVTVRTSQGAGEVVPRGEARWLYGNVYDDQCEPLNWWQDLLKA